MNIVFLSGAQIENGGSYEANDEQEFVTKNVCQAYRIEVSNNKDETVRLNSFQKPKFQCIIIFFVFAQALPP